MEIKWTKLAKDDIKEFYGITQMRKPKEYILSLIESVQLLVE